MTLPAAVRKLAGSQGREMQNIYKLLRLNYVARGHRLKFAAAYLAHALGLRHLAIRFDPVMACNLRCKMCYFSDPAYVRSAKGIFSPEDIERLASQFFPRALLVVFGCSTEPTLYKNYPELVKVAKRYKVPNVSLTTNAQLLKPEAIEKLIDHGLDEITISCHGTARDTYERFMVNASFEKLLSVLDVLEEAKRRRGSRTPELRINYTVNSENLEELRLFFDVFGRYTLSTLQVRPVMDINGEYRTPLGERELDRYNQIIGELGRQCRARRITFLANTADPVYRDLNDTGAIMQAVHRYVGPMNVWREDFDWRKESYDEFCERIGWGRQLLRSIFASLESVVKGNTGFVGKYAAKYEVKL